MTRKKKRTVGKERQATRIIVERVYLGGQSMEDAFQKINEETVKENIEEIIEKSV
ncbi:MAG: hypothetical protein K1W35_22330 [Lachnospiraceae bacterium]